MPTGTSTIFGVFQAILALLLNRTNSAHRDKLMRNEKFASKIFCREPTPFHAAAQKELTVLCEPAPNQCGINGFKVVSLNPDAGFGAVSSAGFQIKNL
jgi:hypothetical protein